MRVYVCDCVCAQACARTEVWRAHLLDVDGDVQCVQQPVDGARREDEALQGGSRGLAAVCVRVCVYTKPAGPSWNMSCPLCMDGAVRPAHMAGEGHITQHGKGEQAAQPRNGAWLVAFPWQGRKYLLQLAAYARS